MENFELVLEVLKCDLNGIEALGFPNGRICIGVETEVLDENKTSVTGNGFGFSEPLEQPHGLLLALAIHQWRRVLVYREMRW
uniref:Uncharacterized protein n=1 Tax=Cannabis sativa TaxID=3483 RepID=A0A803QSS2_CANSA